MEIVCWFILLRSFRLDLTIVGSQLRRHLHLRFLVLWLLVVMLKMGMPLVLSLLMVKLVQVLV